MDLPPCHGSRFQPYALPWARIVSEYPRGGAPRHVQLDLQPLPVERLNAIDPGSFAPFAARQHEPVFLYAPSYDGRGLRAPYQQSVRRVNHEPHIESRPRHAALSVLAETAFAAESSLADRFHELLLSKSGHQAVVAPSIAAPSLVVRGPSQVNFCLFANKREVKRDANFKKIRAARKTHSCCALGWLQLEKTRRISTSSVPC